MYIDPFWAGVIATLLAEMVVFFVAITVAAIRRR
jgi:hypothetical protein